MVRWIVLSLLLLAAVVATAIASGPETTCEPQVDRGVLPEWARTGFSDPEPEIAHVVGARGELAAILFGDPLTAPPDSEHSNKILWVARRTPPPGPLELTAVQGDRTERRTIESGPGPSGVDLPAGCWRISARWPGGEDELELRYREG